MPRLSDLTDERPLEQILGSGLLARGSHTVSLAPSRGQFWTKLWIRIALAGGFFTAFVYGAWLIVFLLHWLFSYLNSGGTSDAMELAVAFAIGPLIGLPLSFGLGFYLFAIVAGIVVALVWAACRALRVGPLWDRVASAAGALVALALALPWLAMFLNAEPSPYHATGLGLAGIVLGHLVVACPVFQFAGLQASIRDVRRRHRDAAPGRFRFGLRALLVSTALLAVLFTTARAAGWLHPVMVLGLAVWVILATISHLVLVGTLNTRSKLRLHRRRQARVKARST